MRTEQWVQYDLSPTPAGSGGPVFGPAGAGRTTPQNSSQCSKWLYDGYFDPLAQTFVLDVATQTAGIDLWFTAKGGPVVVQIRETSNGVPTSTVVVEQRVPLDAIQLGQFTRVTWVPAMLQAKREYAVVVLCDDATTALAIAELGKQDPTQGYVTSQPYQVGVLLSSSNASTWTAHQDRDLTFRLLAAQYTETERVIDLGTADLVDATDLMILGFAERPSAAANLTFDLEFPPALDSEVVRLTDGQVIWLAAPFDWPGQGTRPHHGRCHGRRHPGARRATDRRQDRTQRHYITRTVAASGNNRVLVVYEGDIPGGVIRASACPGQRSGRPLGACALPERQHQHRRRARDYARADRLCRCHRLARAPHAHRQHHRAPLRGQPAGCRFVRGGHGTAGTTH